MGLFKKKGNKKVVKVSDMMCEHCAATITQALEGVDGVSDVKVDVNTKNASFKAVDDKNEAIIQAIKDAGYKPGEIKAA